MSAHSIPAVLRPAGLHCFLCASRHDRRGSSGFDAIERSEGIRDAEALADRILRDTLPLAETGEKRDMASIERLFQLTLNRQPMSEEQTLAAELLQRERATFSASELDSGVRISFVSLCRAMLNLNEFLYID